MKIYTKTGDQGETSLFSGKRVLKANTWVKLYGGLDELNCEIGLLAASLNKHDKFASLLTLLHGLQSNLFSLGSYYASEASKPEHIKLLKEWLTALESSMDSWENELPNLKNFILPGGSFEAALAHKVRVKAREVERGVVESGFEGALITVSYLNRLSDFFFVLARYLNLKLGCEDVIWASGE